ncbi:MAG TPA: hypothetical protein VNE63_21130 [Candidatus Acidoferrales bacterium]|nr:hypothetical protein [Candidatus Acidoferrales bacterium]
MSRKAVALILIAYFVAALAFATFEEIRSQTIAIPAYTFGALVGRAIAVFVPAGIIPVVVWAFFKFKAENASGPLVLWAVLSVAFAYFENYGERTDQVREINNFATLTMTPEKRAEAIRLGVRACLKAQGEILVSRQLLTSQNLETYCRCYMENGLAAMTPDERRQVAETGKPPVSVQPKMDQVAMNCLAAVSKNQFDKDEWVDVPSRQ